MATPSREKPKEEEAHYKVFKFNIRVRFATVATNLQIFSEFSQVFIFGSLLVALLVHLPMPRGGSQHSYCKPTTILLIFITFLYLFPGHGEKRRRHSTYSNTPAIKYSNLLWEMPRYCCQIEIFYFNFYKDATKI